MRLPTSVPIASKLLRSVYWWCLWHHFPSLQSLQLAAAFQATSCTAITSCAASSLIAATTLTGQKPFSHCAAARSRAPFLAGRLAFSQAFAPFFHSLSPVCLTSFPTHISHAQPVKKVGGWLRPLRKIPRQPAFASCPYCWVWHGMHRFSSPRRPCRSLRFAFPLYPYSSGAALLIVYLCPPAWQVQALLIDLPLPNLFL